MTAVEYFEIHVQKSISFEEAQSYLSDVLSISETSIYDEDEFWLMDNMPSEPYVVIRVVSTDEEQFPNFITVDSYPGPVDNTLEVGQYFQQRCECMVAVPLPTADSATVPWSGSLAVFYQDGRKFKAQIGDSASDYIMTRLTEVSSF